MSKSKIRAGLLFVSLVAAPAAFAQTKQSVWDGVYSTAQADRGRGEYLQHCIMCHGASLEGNGEAPPLTGEFIPNWAGTTLGDLYDKISVTMPLNAPGTLNPGTAADILAYLLAKNNFPASASELGSRDSFGAVSFDAVKPQPKAAAPAGKKTKRR
jgi:mono/diheme cytochrome c family protein